MNSVERWPWLNVHTPIVEPAVWELGKVFRTIRKLTCNCGFRAGIEEIAVLTPFRRMLSNPTMRRLLPYLSLQAPLCLTSLVLLFASHAFGAGPVYGLSSLPTYRPISIGYLNALRNATGGSTSYTPSQIITEIDGLNWAGFDAVVHAFAEPKADGTIGESLGNFLAYQSALLTSAHARGKSVIMSIGGAYPGNLASQLGTIANDSTLRTTFSQNIVTYLQMKGYDGVDLDWEFPQKPHPDGSAGSPDVTDGKENMTLLMQAIYSAVKAANPNYIVMFATGPGYYMGNYDFGALASKTDFYFYFGYDWRNPKNGPMTYPGSTQYTTANDQLPEASVRGGLEYVMNQGFPASKIICGFPFYGVYANTDTSWSAVRDTWAANQAGYLAAIDPNSMEVFIGGYWFTSPDCMKKKMDAVLKPSTSVLPNHVTIRGIGAWEIGHEYRLHPDLSMALATWLAAYPPNTTVVSREAAPGGGTQARVTFSTLPGGNYQVQYTNNLTTPVTWQSLGTASPNAQGQFQVIDPAPLPSQRVYRAVYP